MTKVRIVGFDNHPYVIAVVEGTMKSVLAASRVVDPTMPGGVDVVVNSDKALDGILAVAGFLAAQSIGAGAGTFETHLKRMKDKLAEAMTLNLEIIGANPEIEIIGKSGSN